MTLLSLLGTATMLLSLVFGLHAWRAGTQAQRWAIFFLGGSAALQIGQRILSSLHRPNAILGNLWTGWAALTLLSTLIESSHPATRRPMRWAQWVLILFWAGWAFRNPEIFSSKFTPHAALCALGLVFACICMASSLFDVAASGVPFGLWVGAATFLALGIDLYLFLANLGWVHFDLAQLRTAWLIRNVFWCGAYLAFLPALRCRSNCFSSMPA